MAGDVINLRRVRKAKARALREIDAAERRAVHGLTRAARKSIAIERDRANSLLDGARLDGPVPVRRAAGGPDGCEPSGVSSQSDARSDV